MWPNTLCISEGGRGSSFTLTLTVCSGSRFAAGGVAEGAGAVWAVSAAGVGAALFEGGPERFVAVLWGCEFTCWGGDAVWVGVDSGCESLPRTRNGRGFIDVAGVSSASSST